MVKHHKKGKKKIKKKIKPTSKLDDIIDNIEKSREQSNNMSPISKAFEFTHHTGSDPSKELEALKCILMREGLISKVKHYIENNSDNKLISSESSDILNILAQIRDASVDCINAIAKWRKDLSDYPPPVFYWKNENYLIKMISDLDFLSDIDSLVDALNLDSKSLIHNPLMLPQTIDERRELEENDENNENEMKAESKKKSSKNPKQLIKNCELLLIRELSYEDERKENEEYNNNLMTSQSSPTIRNNNEIILTQEEKEHIQNINEWLYTAQEQLDELSNETSHIKTPASEKKGVPLNNKNNNNDKNMKKYEKKKIKQNRRKKKDAIGQIYLEPLFNDSRTRRRLRLPQNKYSGVKSNYMAGTSASKGSKYSKEKNKIKNNMKKKKQKKITFEDISLNISREEISSLCLLSTPTQSLSLVGIILLNILANDDDLSDPSWETFINHINSMNENHFVDLLQNFQYDQLPPYKARAVIPFLRDRSIHPEKIYKYSIIGAKLASWIFLLFKTHPDFNIWYDNNEGDDLIEILNISNNFLLKLIKKNNNKSYNNNNDDKKVKKKKKSKKRVLNNVGKRILSKGKKIFNELINMDIINENKDIGIFLSIYYSNIYGILIKGSIPTNSKEIIYILSNNDIDHYIETSKKSDGNYIKKKLSQNKDKEMKINNDIKYESIKNWAIDWLPCNIELFHEKTKYEFQIKDENIEDEKNDEEKEKEKEEQEQEQEVEEVKELTKEDLAAIKIQCLVRRRQAHSRYVKKKRDKMRRKRRKKKKKIEIDSDDDEDLTAWGGLNLDNNKEDDDNDDNDDDDNDEKADNINENKENINEEKNENNNERDNINNEEIAAIALQRIARGYLTRKEITQQKYRGESIDSIDGEILFGKKVVTEIEKKEDIIEKKNDEEHESDYSDEFEDEKEGVDKKNENSDDI